MYKKIVKFLFLSYNNHMLVFSIIIYTLFGGMCIWFIISGIQKMKEIKAGQEQTAANKSESTEETQNTTETND